MPQLVPSVDATRFTPTPIAHDEVVRRRLGLRGGPVFLAVAGAEARGSTLVTLRAFHFASVALPSAQLVLAGGATPLAQGAYRGEFDAVARSLGRVESARLRTVQAPDDADLPSLFRLATALVFLSRIDGVGPVVLQALATGTPVICATGAPFDHYLGRGDALRVEPADAVALAAAMYRATDAGTAARLRAAGLAASRRFTLGGPARHQAPHVDPTHDRATEAVPRARAG
jgi:glycosyltransferase involved in cell wall biosynthesis